MTVAHNYLRSNLFRAALTLALVALAAPALAQPALERVAGPQNYGNDCLSPNDDGSSPQIDLSMAFPDGLRFFDQTHRSVFVNTNGNITFSERLSQYTPDAFPVADQPMIAPFWADVDIRPDTGGGGFGDDCGGYSGGTTCTSCTPCNWEETPNGNDVWWHLEPGRMIVTWDRVGYYDCNEDRRMTFQLILTAAEGGTTETCGSSVGDFDVEFRFTQCEWETGDASGGSNGTGGTQAQSGFDAGDETNFVSLPGSRMAGIAQNLCQNSNVGQMGVWRFQIRGGSVICPDAGQSCRTGRPGVCEAGVTACVAAGTECVEVNTPRDELCDALDNDCDGRTDEGEDLCSANDICDRGRCVVPCFEGRCDEGLECDETRGVCVDMECNGVNCPDGQRCDNGTCVGACEGIVCPSPTSCVGGACVDICSSITCDPECEVCEDGACTPRCDMGGSCAADEMCSDDGTCVHPGCMSMTCPVGTICEAGACIDPCVGATCPRGEVCEMGRCYNPNDSNPPPPPGSDGGTSTPPGTDAGTGTGGEPVRNDPGCSCATAPSPAEGAGWLFVLAFASLGLRRRRD